MDAKETILNVGVSGFYAWFVYVLLVMATSGCAGEIYLGTRRIDEVRQEQVMKDKPLKCLFVNCDNNVRGS